MTSWTCQAEPSAGLTVGQKYTVDCSGGEVQWPDQDLVVIVPEAQMFQLKVLKFEAVTQKNVKFTATSYQPGEIKLEKLVLKSKSDVQANAAVELGAWSVKVESVIQGKPEPYGPFGPFLINWPLWLWILFASLFFALSALAGWLYYLKKRKREWAKIVNEHSTSLLPYHQFYKDTRKILRTEEDEKLRLKKLEECFRLYFLRELEVPTLDQEPKWILSHLYKRDPRVGKALKDEFLQVFREMRRAQQSKQDFAFKDTEQITHHCQKIVDGVYESLRGDK